MRQLFARALAAGLLIIGAAGAAQAQTIPLTGGTYSQNFDTLSNAAGSTTNSALPSGWLMTETGGGARDNEQYAVDTGASTTGDTYSYGSAGSTERAFGGLRSGTLIPVIGTCFTNNTGNALAGFSIAYTGEEWRLGTAARTDRMDFQYSLNATSLTTGTWTDVDALDFTTPNTATTGAKDGNAAANRTAISSNVSTPLIGSGATFCIRWNDFDASGADDGLAIDDFSITVSGSPVPVVSINDVAALEGDSGTTNFFFAFGLSQPAGPGGVSIQYATADGTATAGSDYTADAGTLFIPEGSSSVAFSIAVNGDTVQEADETFFVNIVSAVGANIADGQGQGTIQNDDVTVVPIHAIQGSGLSSPLNGQIVTTEGIVTAQKFNNGFFLQTTDAEADADPNTSQGIFVFTSTAPPASAAIGNRVRVTATVSEFTPSTNLNQLSITELVSVTGVQVLSSGNALPTPVTLTAADFGPGTNPGTAEKYEGMRVAVPSARVVEPSDGNITESSATSSTTGVFQIALTGVARPFREPGLDQLDLFPVPSGKTPPRFDHNPERIMVRSRGQVGATALAVDNESIITNMTGVMDYFSGVWAVLPDVGAITVSGGKTATPVADAHYEDVTIGGFNLERFFDEVADGNGAPTLTASALDKRLTKTGDAICTYLKTPDILGVVEVENLRVLGLLADRINSTCPSAPQYVPYLVQGNDVGGINVGFLVSTRNVGGSPRVEVSSVTQYGKDTLFNNPDSSTSLLNDRPPLLLRAIVHQDNGATFPITAIINHLRSLNGLDSTAAGSSGWPTEGDRIRNKRGQQAAFLGNLVQTLQQADPNERIILLGDFNAYQFSDGYVDVLGIVRGDEVAADQVVTHIPSPVTRPLTDGSLFTADPNERYSYVFDGNAQTLDHALLNDPLILGAASLSVDHARINSDFGVHHYGETGNSLRVSDHDPVRVAIGVGDFRSADLSLAASSSVSSVAAGASVPFTVTVNNAGPNAASSAAVALVFNALVTPAVVAPAGWTCAAPTQTATDTTVACTNPSFANGGSATFSATVTAPSQTFASTLTMAASIQSQTRDRANADNTSSVSVAVAAMPLPSADLQMRMVGGPAGTVRGGSLVTFQSIARNAGPNPAASPVATFTGNVALANATVLAPPGWTCNRNGTATSFAIDCTLTTSMAVGSKSTFALSVVTPAVGSQPTLSVTSAVSASSITESVPVNNTATYSASIVP